MINPSFWAGRKVLLTGHSGFKGGWMSLWLQKMGADLLGFSLDLPSQPNLYEAAQVGLGMKERHGDLRNLSDVIAAVQQHQPEVVIHMAAQSTVRYS